MPVHGGTPPRPASEQRGDVHPGVLVSECAHDVPLLQDGGTRGEEQVLTPLDTQDDAPGWQPSIPGRYALERGVATNAFLHDHGVGGDSGDLPEARGESPSVASTTSRIARTRLPGGADP